MHLALGLLAGYLIGSTPFAVLLARRRLGFDVLRNGTRNPGATNVFRNVGRITGAVVGFLDYFKALVPALVAESSLGWSPPQAAALAIGAVLGHDFSIFLRLRGGKGGASTLGVFSYLDFPALLGVGLIWALSLPFLKSRRFVAGPAALSLFPLLAALHHSPPGSSILPGWGVPSGRLATLAGLGLIGLLWSRIVPGLVRRPREAG